MREIERNPYTFVLYYEGYQLILFKRSSLQYPNIGELEQSFARMNAALTFIRGPQVRMLIDTRDAPPRNDAAFEGTVLRLHQELVHGIAKIAVLVQTRAGILQIKRLAHEGRLDQVPFMDLDAALAHLDLPAAEVRRLLPSS